MKNELMVAGCSLLEKMGIHEQPATRNQQRATSNKSS